MLPAETQRIIDKHGIKYVLAQFVDIHGAAQTKSVPICGLKRAPVLPVSRSVAWAWSPTVRTSWPAATCPR